MPDLSAIPSSGNALTRPLFPSECPADLPALAAPIPAPCVTDTRPDTMSGGLPVTDTAPAMMDGGLPVTPDSGCTMQPPLSVTCAKCGRVMPPSEPVVYIHRQAFGHPPEYRCFDCHPPYEEHTHARIAPWRDPYPMIRCWHCGREVRFEKKIPLRYCSDACQKAYSRQQRRQKRCPVCGKVFIGGRADALTCSPACRQKAYRQRRAAQ